MSKNLKSDFPKLLICLSAAFIFTAATPTPKASSVPSAGTEYKSVDGAGSVNFQAVGKPSFLKINGKGSPATGTFTVSEKLLSGEATFDLTSLNSGIGMRDDHMKNRFLEVGKFPKSTLKISRLALTDSLVTACAGSSGSGTLPFSGSLNLHGVDRAVTGSADITCKDADVDVKADFTIKLTDFGITIPSYAGITVADDVHILVDLRTQKTVPASAKSKK